MIGTKRLSRYLTALLLVSVLFLTSVQTGLFLPQARAADQTQVKNVIVMVPDGCGSAHTTLARWYRGGNLVLDEMVRGAVRTYSAESLITDSAPAATAFATGYKSNTKFISVLPANVSVPGVDPSLASNKYKPVATILEGAKLSGKATGLIATSNIQHATPACFSSHWHNRNDYNEIAEQQVYQNMDVVLGGGKQYLLPKDQGGKRTDGANLIEELKSRGYEVVENTAALVNSTSNKLWGLFANDSMAYDMDRNPAQEPALAQMTQKAIDILSKDPDGFFLFVEGSEVDWASHANDPVGVISEVLAFDDAVRVALDFAKKDGNTLVLAFTDHGNGGMSIGNTSSDHNYDKLPYTAVLDLLKKAKVTGAGIEAKLNPDRSNVKEVMAEYFGITDLTDEEVAAIKAARPGSMNGVVGPMISKRAYIGWTTSGHTGEDVFLYAYGPWFPYGTLENTDLARVAAKAMGFSLDTVNQNLFVPARQGFQAIGASIAWDAQNPANPVIVVQKGQVTAKLYVSTNVMEINGVKKELNGVIVNGNGTSYVPQQAIDLFAEAAK